MSQTILSNAVNAVRFRYAILFVILVTAIYWFGIHPWMANWGSTAAEREMPLPGDELTPGKSGQATKAITIHAAPDVIWQWLVQVGQDRAGFYTYTWLENLVGADIHNADEIHPEWQQLSVGDVWRLVPQNYLGGLGKDAVDPVLLIDKDHALVLKMWGAHVILPADEHTSRLIVRGQSGAADPLTVLIVDPIVFTMERRMLLGLKARAEGRPDAPAALMGMAHFGWITAGVVVTGLFLSERRRWFWLALPALATLPSLLMGHDVQAGLAAFIATGIIVLGFLIYGRGWWGPLLVIGSIVLLTLLLAPEAYIAIGLVFALIILAMLVVTIINRARVAESTPDRLAARSP